MAGPKVGDRAPGFELPGSGARSYRLDDYRGKGVILAFYPGDFTRVCTAQFCSYRDNPERLAALGLDLLGISSQSVESHDRWTAEQNLTVPLLTDEDLAVARLYGVVGFAGPVGKLVGLSTKGGSFTQRAIFVVNGDLVVRHRQVSRTGATFQDVDDLAEAVAALS